ncbi:HD-GYP domain-containing protein [Xylophilus sp.]|uniref:HD-GYP domain-containing protein n=1 Tax=Xylophilus sp. TaxID=2653893 RepID=UPI0013B6A499|nr:HD-GYP domain-containing protein [Xylophilus sp.]KAF1050242.1 MAG: Cyclic di-GMP phosphodiesterase [Xylophilus sp.]
MLNLFSRTQTPADGPAGTLRRIPVADLREGMFVQRFAGAWINHSFWRTAFLVGDAQTLQAIRASGIGELWIDTARGLDVAGVPPQPTPPVAGGGDDGDAAEDAADAIPDEAAAPTAQAPAAAARAAGPAKDFDDARRICAHGRDAVAAMFHELRMGRTIRSAEAMALVEDIAGSVERHPEALIGMARLKRADDHTFLHSVAVCALMVALGRRLGLPADLQRQAGLAGLLHNMGKAQMPMEILNKPGRLTEEEFAVIRGHAEAGWELLRSHGTAPDAVLDVVLHHHEKFDGSGYPHRLAGGSITLPSRMGTVCDVYDAVTSNRPYNRGWDPALAVRRMHGWTGHFDPAVLQAFFKSVGIYPSGALVRLRSGRLAVVMGAGSGSLLAPKVRVFYSTLTSEPIVAEVVDRSAPSCRDRITALEDPDVWKFKNLDTLWLP